MLYLELASSINSLSVRVSSGFLLIAEDRGLAPHTLLKGTDSLAKSFQSYWICLPFREIYVFQQLL
jgi:hypothetical protein